VKATLERPVKRPQGVVAHAEGRAGPVVGLELGQVLPAHLLDGGEVVHFALKPSPWFVVLVSIRWVAVGIALSYFSMTEWVPHASRWYLYYLGFSLAAARIGWGMLEWVSRLYVLTNRRVMRIRGVFNVELFECSLDRIQNTYLTLSILERITRTGTISFQTAAGSGGSTGTASWRIVARPLEVHEQLREAVIRSRNRGHHDFS
jgi:uncharacterized membrane protein YdbT with pleckstrin-like domain